MCRCCIHQKQIVLNNFLILIISLTDINMEYRRFLSISMTNSRKLVFFCLDTNQDILNYTFRSRLSLLIHFVR